MPGTGANTAADFTGSGPREAKSRRVVNPAKVDRVENTCVLNEPLSYNNNKILYTSNLNLVLPQTNVPLKETLCYLKITMSKIRQLKQDLPLKATLI